MDATEARFLEEREAHPDDTSVRHLYADWLAVNGEPTRAGFLRAQVAMWDLTADDPRFASTAQLLQALTPRIEVGWRARDVHPCATTDHLRRRSAEGAYVTLDPSLSVIPANPPFVPLTGMVMRHPSTMTDPASAPPPPAPPPPPVESSWIRTKLRKLVGPKTPRG